VQKIADAALFQTTTSSAIKKKCLLSSSHVKTFVKHIKKHRTLQANKRYIIYL